MTEIDVESIEIRPRDQRRAAKVAQGFVTGDGLVVAEVLVELADAGLERALAVVSLLARHLGVTLVELVGQEAAERQIERTVLDAMVADDETDGE